MINILVIKWVKGNTTTKRKFFSLISRSICFEALKARVPLRVGVRSFNNLEPSSTIHSHVQGTNVSWWQYSRMTSARAFFIVRIKDNEKVCVEKCVDMIDFRCFASRFRSKHVCWSHKFRPLQTLYAHPRNPNMENEKRNCMLIVSWKLQQHKKWVPRKSFN